MEVDGNKLISRDDATNAIVPVVYSYEENMENKQIDGNRLAVRDLETNALIPVVKIKGFASDNQDGSFPVINDDAEYTALSSGKAYFDNRGSGTGDLILKLKM